jgi:hypothetical protein
VAGTVDLGETLVDHVPMRRRQKHPMPVMSHDPASEYAKALAVAFGKGFKRNKPILWENHVSNHGDTWPQLAVLKDHWRLVMTKDSSRVELFNIFDDWEEKRDLAINYPTIVNELKGIALDYNKSLPSTDTFDERLCVPKASKP